MEPGRRRRIPEDPRDPLGGAVKAVDWTVTLDRWNATVLPSHVAEPQIGPLAPETPLERRKNTHFCNSPPGARLRRRWSVAVHGVSGLQPGPAQPSRQ
eukprot:gene18866-biopygen12984